MRIIISPAKKMRVDTDSFACGELPVFLDRTDTPMIFKLTDTWGNPIPEAELYKPWFGERCQTCGMKQTCNGCSRCGKCEGSTAAAGY